MSVRVVKDLKVVKINIDKVDLALMLGIEFLGKGRISETVVQTCHGILRVKSPELLVHKINLMTLVHVVHGLRERLTVCSEVEEVPRALLVGDNTVSESDITEMKR